MRVFLTGASGFVGSAIIPELVRAGHRVLGLARSDASAEKLAAAGVDVHRGALTDLDSLRRGAAACDGVIHCAFSHDDFNDYAGNCEKDRGAIEALGSALVGSERPLVIASGIARFTPGRVATEDETPDTSTGGLGGFFALDTPASSALTQARFGWKPEQAGLLADLERGTYLARA
ncbi:NAD-dependent epimerase/dehydratase family protein [Sorangium sp. So ce291]